ncbi:hypothetical protein L484_024838 [Morus notabilis]|uniref:Uncharacterized protein n=1 Tax=Morus notabilis TaxID=981085 RepID=W9QWU4_9ROSA|nr:hypothetical protein L484_024838 [Morus notabilis]
MNGSLLQLLCRAEKIDGVRVDGAQVGPARHVRPQARGGLGPCLARPCTLQECARARPEEKLSGLELARGPSPSRASS